MSGVLCFGRTVFESIAEEHQAHGHQARRLVIVIQLGLHERLEGVQITEVLVHVELVQEVTCGTQTEQWHDKQTHTLIFMP